MSIYSDPTIPGRVRPSLIGDLIALKATTAHHALEDQSTTVLAWLVDRSPAIARGVLKLFLGESGAVPGAIGAATQVSLPKPNGGALRPDLSICAADRTLQLLIEVKVASDFGTHAEFDDRRQDDTYRHLWGQPAVSDAKLRAVGTLTRDPQDAKSVDLDRHIARDVSWRELRDVIAGLLHADEVAADVALVAQSFVDAIDHRIAPKPPTADELRSFLRDHESLLDTTSRLVAEGLATSHAVRKISGTGFAGRRIQLQDQAGESLAIRLYLAAAGSRLAIPGASDALVVGPERGTDGFMEPEAHAALEAAGFPRLKDIEGWAWRRRVWPLDHLSDATQIADEIVPALLATRLIRTPR